MHLNAIIMSGCFVPQVHGTITIHRRRGTVTATAIIPKARMSGQPIAHSMINLSMLLHASPPSTVLLMHGGCVLAAAGSFAFGDADYARNIQQGGQVGEWEQSLWVLTQVGQTRL